MMDIRRLAYWSDVARLMISTILRDDSPFVYDCSEVGLSCEGRVIIEETMYQLISEWVVE